MKTLQLMEKGKLASSPEYSVYIYYFLDHGRDFDTDWEKKEITDDLGHALMQAKILHESGAYRKVEVKKKFFDFHHDITIDTTLKIYEKPQSRWWAAIGALIRPVSSE